jgi:hypothetical protein
MARFGRVLSGTYEGEAGCSGLLNVTVGTNDMARA